MADGLTLPSQLAMLRNEKAQYAISYLSESNAAMTFSSGFNRGDINLSKLFVLPMYLVIKRDNPNADEIMSKINLANNYAHKNKWKSVVSSYELYASWINEVELLKSMI